MTFDQELERGTLIKRYKRFLADITRTDGTSLTVHCPNSGSMKTCSTPGSPVCFSSSDNPKRKYPHTLEMVHNGHTWIGVNTARTNGLVAEAIREGRVDELRDRGDLRREVKTAEGSRLDILLERGADKTYVEVKNCSLVVDGCALFPDAVTARGTKHLLELARLAGNGHRAVIFFLVQRLDGTCFSPAKEIDPLYASTLRDVHQRGVEILVYQAKVTPESIDVTSPLPLNLDI